MLLDLGLSQDMLHARHAQAVSVRAREGDVLGRFGLWVIDTPDRQKRADYFASVEYNVCPHPWTCAAGLGWIDDKNGVTGTRFNVSVVLERQLTKGVSIELQHFSHASCLGVREGRNNSGWNFLGIRVEIKP